MEPPQASRTFPAEGRKATHDFLSLHGHSPVQQDPRPSSQGGFLRTHNFLQPLEIEDKRSVKEDVTHETNIVKTSPPAPPPIEQVWPGGITFSHVSYLHPRMPKSEGTPFSMAPVVCNNNRNDEDPNCSSYTAASRFHLWDESSARKGKTGKENSSDLNVGKEAMLRNGQWPTEWLSESSSNNPNSFSSRASSLPPAQKNQSFVQMLIGAKVPGVEEEYEDKAITLVKQGNTQTGELRVKVDDRVPPDQKPSTPRSKHSATEQRRRCKINDRFHMLRELIPHSDQKRDKASFLLEVIEYIQFLQEKVSRYEGRPGWSSEPTKLTPWQRSNPKQPDDQAPAADGSMLVFKPDGKNNAVTSNIPRMQQNPDEPDTNNPICLKAMDQQFELADKASSIPVLQLQPNTFPSLRNNNAVTQPACRLVTIDKSNAPLQQLQTCERRARSPEINSAMSNQGLDFEGGTISISSAYSQGLLNTLTQALKSSGVDVSQASISVQVDVGKQTNSAQKKASKDFDINCDTPSLVHERVETSHFENSHHPAKRQNTLKS